MNKRLIFSIGVCVLQVVDLLVHVLTGNIEPLRILCMGGIIFTVVLSYFIQSQSFQIIRGSIIGYLIGNGVFLLQNGIFNNEGFTPHSFLCLCDSYHYSYGNAL